MWFLSKIIKDCFISGAIVTFLVNQCVFWRLTWWVASTRCLGKIPSGTFFGWNPHRLVSSSCLCLPNHSLFLQKILQMTFALVWLNPCKKQLLNKTNELHFANLLFCVNFCIFVYLNICANRSPDNNQKWKRTSYQYHCVSAILSSKYNISSP